MLLCFISTDAGGIQGAEGCPRGHRIQTFAFTSVAGYAGPSSSLQTTPEVPVLLRLSGLPSSLQTTPEIPILLSEVQSRALDLLCLIRGVRRGGRDPPIMHFVLGG